MSFTNAMLAQKIADLIDYWSSFNQEYSDWLGGTVDGGPGSDGKYPLTNWAGAESLVDSPAKLADNVSGYVGLASASEAAAAASAAAAATSESNASTSAATATAQAALADADRVAAELAEANALSSQTVATTQANLATDRAGYAQEWAITVEDTLVSVAAGGNGTTDYSALHWAAKSAGSASAASTSETNAADSAAAAAASAIEAATFDPALYAALADNETVTGQYTFSHASGILIGAAPLTATLIGQWNTAYSWGDHAGLYSLVSHNHAGVYEPADATILKDADIGVTVAAFSHNHSGVYEPADATILKDADIGVTVAAFSHTHEGTAIDATGITDGYVLTADGAGNAAWEAASGGIEEDVAFGTAAMQLALSSSNSGLQIRASTTSGSWARGMGVFKQSDLSRIGGAGFFGSNEAISKFSIGFGSTWWDGTSGDALLELHADGELSLYSALAGNTHFNFQGVGNNYITHGNGDFTRFRGFDGVSAYTTIAEFDDNGLHVSGGRIREGTKSHIMQLDIAGGSYYGMHVNDADTAWIRTTTLGLLPHSSGGASSLGTNAWPFSSIYGDNIHAKNFFRADNANIEGSIGTFGSDVLHYGVAMRGGGFDSTSSAYTGYCRIAFPANTTGDSCMFTMMIHGYNYDGTRGQGDGGHWCIAVSGYYYSSENWANTSARIVTGSPPFDRVLFGEASDGKKYILLGTTSTNWNYPKVWLTDATFGHSTQDDWTAGDWNISFSTSSPTGWSQDSSSSPVYIGGQIRWDGEYGTGAANKSKGGRITISTSAASGGNDGDIHFKY